MAFLSLSVQGIIEADFLMNLPSRHHLLRIPSVASAYVHVLDEAQFDFLFPASLGQRKDLTFVDASFDHGVQFDSKAHGPGPYHRSPDSFGIQRSAGYFPGDWRIDRIEADVEAVKTGLAKGIKVFLESKPVGRDRQVQIRRRLAQKPDQVADVSSKEWFSTGDANLSNSQWQKGFDGPVDLFVAQDFFPWRKGKAGAEQFFRQAVLATQVATVGNRDPQILERALERIDNSRHPFGFVFFAQPQLVGSSHSFVPSEYASNFQIGTVSLIRSIR